MLIIDFQMMRPPSWTPHYWTKNAPKRLVGHYAEFCSSQLYQSELVLLVLTHLANEYHQNWKNKEIPCTRESLMAAILDFFSGKPVFYFSVCSLNSLCLIPQSNTPNLLIWVSLHLNYGQYRKIAIYYGGHFEKMYIFPNISIWWLGALFFWNQHTQKPQYSKFHALFQKWTCFSPISSTIHRPSGVTGLIVLRFRQMWMSPVKTKLICSQYMDLIGDRPREVGRRGFWVNLCSRNRKSALDSRWNSSQISSTICHWFLIHKELSLLKTALSWKLRILNNFMPDI